jgi:hypothetical protein
VGGIRTSGRSIIEWVTELVGFKAGLAISERDVARSLDRAGYPDWYPGVSDELTRVRSEEVEIVAYSAMDAFCVPGAMRITVPLDRAVGRAIGDWNLARRASDFMAQKMLAHNPWFHRDDLFSRYRLPSTEPCTGSSWRTPSRQR